MVLLNPKPFPLTIYLHFGVYLPLHLISHWTGYSEKEEKEPFLVFLRHPGTDQQPTILAPALPPPPMRPGKTHLPATQTDKLAKLRASHQFQILSAGEEARE